MSNVELSEIREKNPKYHEQCVEEPGRSDFPTARDNHENDGTEITTIKASLEANKSELRKIIQQDSDYSANFLELQELIKKTDDNFRLQEASSFQHAQYQARENATFFSKKAQEIQQIIGKKTEFDWLASLENFKQTQVRAFEEQLKQIESLLIQRQDLYEKLSEAYDGKVVQQVQNGEEDEGAKNILSQFEIDGVTSTDEHLIVGEHGSISFVEAKEEETRAEAYREGKILVEISIMKYFGIDALQRFRETFHVDTIYEMPLIVGKVKDFIDAEHVRAKKIAPQSVGSYFYSSIDSLERLQNIAKEEENRQIRSNGHQLHFNPFSGEEPSFEYHITNFEQTALEGIIAVRGALRNEDFYKNAIPINQQDILKRFDKKFLGDKKTLLTIKECNQFIREERQRSQSQLEKLYYRCFSEPHKLKQKLWSCFAAIVSGERAQPPFTDTDHFYRSLEIAVGSAYAMGSLNDATRTFRKEAKTQDDNSLFESLKRESNIENPYEGLYRDFAESKGDLERKKNKEISDIEAKRTIARGHPGMAIPLTPVRSGEKKKVEAEFEKSITDLSAARKTLALEMLERANLQDPLIQEINPSSNEEVQQVVDNAFQILKTESEKIVTQERENLFEVHQALETLSQFDFSQNRLCSSSDVKTMQRFFEETKASFLFQQARFHEGVQDMDQLRQTAVKNKELFSEKARSFQRKKEGGEQTAIRMENSNDKQTAEKISAELLPLKQMQQIAEEVAKIYDQFSKIYSLKIERSGADEENSSSLTDQLEILRALPDTEHHKIIVSHNGNLREVDPDQTDVSSSHTALKQNGIALVKQAIFDFYGQEGVRKFENSIQFKTANKEALSVKELQNILNTQFPNSEAKSYFLGAGHSIIDLMKSAESEDEDKRVIRSNGRTFFYNPFLEKEPAQEYLRGDYETAAEGVEEAFVSILGLEFFKQSSLRNQYDILKKFNERFRKEEAVPLTVKAFKDFVKEETESSKTWKHWLYYKFYDPWILSQEWSGFMGFVTGIRFQNLFSTLPLSEKFEITWAIDVLGEYFGQYREYSDGGTYKKLIDAALDGKKNSSTRSVDVPDFEKILEQALQEKKRQEQGDVYQYVRAHEEYSEAVKKIRSEQKKFVSKLLKNRIATLADVDCQKNLLVEALEKITASNETALAENIKNGMQLLLQDVDTFSAHVRARLDKIPETITGIINSSSKENPLFSEKEKQDLENLQKTLRTRLAELSLEEVRAQQDPERLSELHALAIKNAEFFSIKAADIEAKFEGAWHEANQIYENGGTIKRKPLSIFDELNKTLITAADAYGELADAYKMKVIDQRSKKSKQLPEGGVQQQESFLSQIENLLPGERWKQIVLNQNGNLDVSYKVDFKTPSYEVQNTLTRILQLLKLEIANSFGMDAVERFENFSKMKTIVQHPLTVGDIQQFLNLEKTIHDNDKAMYLSPDSSLDRLLLLPASGQLIRSQGMVFRYNPFKEKEQQQNYLTGEKEMAKEGVKAVFEGLKKMEFYKKLTSLNQEWVDTHFKNRFDSPEKTWFRYFKSFFFDEEKVDPLTLEAFQEFVKQEKQESEKWKYYYQFRDNPLASSIAWNFIAGTGVIARIDPRIINCTPIDLAIHYGGHRYLIHTFGALGLIPHALHALPAILIAYQINSWAEPWLKSRQRRIEPIR